MSQTAIRRGFLQRKMLQFRVKIQLEIFVEIFSVMGADHAVVADGDAGHDLHAGADPNISPHADGQVIHIPQLPQAGLTGCPAVANTVPGPIMQSSPI